MCGISGILDFSAIGIDRAELQKMIGALHHRGPDGYGFYHKGPVGLAHARLSIIDLSTGDQPIANEDQTIWTVFNGEIFNYIELRATLEQAGHVFRTHSDTETIVHAYEEYGDDFVQHLNGQFAIAIWDEVRQRLVLARDRTGIRPLFYTQKAGRLLFASEVKALQAAGCALEIDPAGLSQVFTFWSAVDVQTVFRGIQSLPPGHLLVAEAGQVRTAAYWQWSQSQPSVRPLSFDEAAEALRELLIDAVRLQLRADVPVGAYLSGGLDSSVIVSLIRNFTSNDLRTFSVAFEDSEFDESAYQQRMVDYLGTHHSVIRCTRGDIGRQFPRLVWHAETPVVRTAPVPLMQLSGLVRQSGYKVVLTGEGADEVFAGYDLFKEAKIRRFWARQPGSRWRPLLLKKLYPYLRNSPVEKAGFASSFFGQGLEALASPGYAHAGRWATTRRTLGFLSPGMREQVAGMDVEEALYRSLPADFADLDGLSRDQYMEARTLLAGYLLSSQGDRVAMTNSIEGRFPFLDHRVIEFANALPARYKLRGLTEKAVLRRAMSGLLPTEVATRVKQPYRAPDCDSFFQDGRPLEYVAELMSQGSVNAAGYFDGAMVTRLFEKCRTGKAIGFGDNMSFVAILSTMLLHEMYVKRRGLEAVL